MGDRTRRSDMKKPTMTLQDVERALSEQDEQLQAAYRALTERNGEPPVAPTDSALEGLDEACRPRPLPSTASQPANGIRC
jgi:hypothetical protein